MGEKYVIDIDKDDIPYSFPIELNGVSLDLTVHYNAFADLFTVDVDVDEETVAYGLPLIYGQNVFSPVSHVQLNNVVIAPYEYGQPSGRVTYENLGETVFLYHESGEDVE